MCNLIWSYPVSILSTQVPPYKPHFSSNFMCFLFNILLPVCALVLNDKSIKVDN